MAKKYDKSWNIETNEDLEYYINLTVRRLENNYGESVRYCDGQDDSIIFYTCKDGWRDEYIYKVKLIYVEEDILE